MLQKEGTNSRYLDITLLDLGQSYTKIAYVQDVKSGVSKLETGFYTFYIKDIHSNVVGARLFNVDNFIAKGFVASALKGRAVSITFIAQEFRGSVSLVIQEISEYSGDIDRSKFIGRVENSDEYLDYSSKFLSAEIGQEVTLPHRYSIESINAVCGGKSGGYAKLVNMVCMSAHGYVSMPTIDSKVFAFVLYKAIIHYNGYLKRLNDIDIITNKEILSILNGVKESKREEVNDYIIDTLSALTGLTKPEHLYANIIYDCFRMAEKNLNMCEIWNTIPVGFTKEVGDSKLVKY